MCCVVLCDVHSGCALSCLRASQVEWIQQQVVKRRIKRDYKPAPPRSLSSPAHSSAAQGNVFYNDAKWSSMWYIVSALHIRESLFSFACLQHHNEIKQMSHTLATIAGRFEAFLIRSSQRIELCCLPAFTQVAGQRSLEVVA